LGVLVRPLDFKPPITKTITITTVLSLYCSSCLSLERREIWTTYVRDGQIFLGGRRKRNRKAYFSSAGLAFSVLPDPNPRPAV
ncbi:MAG: hypothetical protein ACK51L_01575, partial [bacterium]